jgi:uncharacterized Zn-finger protein
LLQMDSLSFESLDSIHEVSHEVVIEEGRGESPGLSTSSTRPLTSSQDHDKEQEDVIELAPGLPLSTSTPKKKNHLCNTCGKVYSHRWSLTQHERHMHKIGGGSRYKCTYCEKEFMSKSYFDSHVNAHEHKKPFPCPTCDKHFQNVVCLRKHRVTCPVENPTAFSCDECPKSFSRKDYLTKHKQTHGLRFRCLECLKGFQHLSSLSRHKKVCSKNTQSNKQSNL